MALSLSRFLAVQALVSCVRQLRSEETDFYSGLSTRVGLLEGRYSGVFVEQVE